VAGLLWVVVVGGGGSSWLACVTREASPPTWNRVNLVDDLLTVISKFQHKSHTRFPSRLCRDFLHFFSIR
jgi:hypothetical protein